MVLNLGFGSIGLLKMVFGLLRNRFAALTLRLQIESKLRTSSI